MSFKTRYKEEDLNDRMRDIRWYIRQSNGGVTSSNELLSIK